MADNGLVVAVVELDEVVGIIEIEADDAEAQATLSARGARTSRALMQDFKISCAP